MNKISVVHETQIIHFPQFAAKQVEQQTMNGLSWVCRFSTNFAAFDTLRKIDRCVYLSWKFEWNETELKEKGFDGFEGTITANYQAENEYISVPFDVELTHSGKWIRRRVGTFDETKKTVAGNDHYLKFKISLNSFSLKSKRPASGGISTVPTINDAVLVVEGEKIDVNKNVSEFLFKCLINKHLSVHSNYFNTMFNSDFKEKSMPEIPINDVKYVDFARLLDAIHPTNPVAPTDENAENLLELADRFMIPAVTGHVENYLIRGTDFPLKFILLMADKYKLDKLLDLNLKLVTTERHMRLLTHFSKLAELSDATRSKILGRFAVILRKTDPPI